MLFTSPFAHSAKTYSCGACVPRTSPAAPLAYTPSHPSRSVLEICLPQPRLNWRLTQRRKAALPSPLWMPLSALENCLSVDRPISIRVLVRPHTVCFSPSPFPNRPTPLRIPLSPVGLCSDIRRIIHPFQHKTKSPYPKTSRVQLHEASRSPAPSLFGGLHNPSGSGDIVVAMSRRPDPRCLSPSL